MPIRRKTTETICVEELERSDVTGSAESDLCVRVCVCVCNCEKETEEEQQVCKWKREVCTVRVCLFVSALQMKLGHSSQLSRAKDKLATEVG